MTTRLPILAALTSLMLSAGCEVPLQDQYELRSSSSVPKGLAYDSEPQVFYATALSGGEITMITSLGREYLFYASDEANLSFSAAAVDVERRVLWVCAVDRKSEPALPHSAILGLDLDDRDVVHRVDLREIRDDYAPNVCEALDVSDDGVVYIADALQPAIYTFDPADGHTSVLLEDPLLDSELEHGVGLSGLALHPDGEHLLAAKSAPPELYVIPLASPEALEKVRFPGEPLGRQSDPRLPAAGGIGFVDETLYVTFPGALQQITFTDQDRLRTARVRTTTAVPSGISAVTAADGAAYAIDSDAYSVEQLGLRPDAPFSIVRVGDHLFSDK